MTTNSDSESLPAKIAGYTVAGIGIVIAFGFIIVLEYIVSGWVLSVMWGWFMVPVFSLPELTILEAIGISLVIGLFLNALATKSGMDEETDISKRLGKAIARAFASPLIALGVGWIVTLFM